MRLEIVPMGESRIGEVSIERFAVRDYDNIFGPPQPNVTVTKFYPVAGDKFACEAFIAGAKYALKQLEGTAR